MHLDWWTLALQTVNVLILVWILGRFFFRPVAAIVARRQEEANKLLADAEATRRQAEEAKASAEKAGAEIDARRLGLLDEARKEAMVEKARLIEEASGEAAKTRAAATAAIERARAEAEEAVLQHAGELSLTIARRLLERLRPDVALAAFAEGLGREIRALPAEMRAGLNAAAAGAPLELSASSDLSDEDKRLVRDRLAQALGFDPTLEFRRDEALLAGLELRGPTIVVRNNWRSDLDRIREELARDQRRKA